MYGISQEPTRSTTLGQKGRTELGPVVIAVAVPPFLHLAMTMASLSTLPVTVDHASILPLDCANGTLGSDRKARPCGATKGPVLD